MRALGLMLLVTMLPLLGGRASASLGVLLGLATESHSCVCPIGPDGDCECPECIRLGLHEHHDDSEEAEHDGASLRSGCDSGPVGAPRLLPMDPALPLPMLAVIPPSPTFQRARLDADHAPRSYVSPPFDPPPRSDRARPSRA